MSSSSNDTSNTISEDDSANESAADESANDSTNDSRELSPDDLSSSGENTSNEYSETRELT